jgi:hypothetical protein
VIPTLRADSNPVEFLWTACALLGLLIGCFMLRETWLGLGALRHYGVNGVRRREATRDLRTSLGFVLIFLTFAEVGLGAMFSPPPVYSANQRVANLLGLTLLVVEPALVLAKWANWRDQTQSLGQVVRQAFARDDAADAGH